MKNYQRLKGLIAASFTPMDAQGKINLSVIDKYADLMAKSDMTGVFVCGTTGESQSLTTNERKNILEQWVKSSNGRFKVIVHVGSNSQVEAIELARHAAETGADAIAAMAPCFFKPETVKDLDEQIKSFMFTVSPLIIPFYFNFCSRNEYFGRCYRQRWTNYARCFCFCQGNNNRYYYRY